MAKVKPSAALAARARRNPPASVKVHVRRLSDREIVHSVEVSNPTERKVERVVLGMLRNMNTDEYFVDDSEADEVTR